MSQHQGTLNFLSGRSLKFLLNFLHAFDTIILFKHNRGGKKNVLTIMTIPQWTFHVKIFHSFSHTLVKKLIVH